MLLGPPGNELCQEGMNTQLSDKLLPSSLRTDVTVTVFMLGDYVEALRSSGVPRGGWGVQIPPSPKFQRPSKIVPNSTRFVKTEFRTPTPQDVWKKVSKFLKLPRFAVVFTLAMTNKLVVINSLKVPKIKKILLYEMKFLVPNYSCLQNP